MELEPTIITEEDYDLNPSKVHDFEIMPKSMKLDIIKIDKYYIRVILNDPKEITNEIYKSNTIDKALKVFDLIDKEMERHNYKITKGESKPYFEFKLFPEVYDTLKKCRKAIDLEVYYEVKEEKRNRYEKLQQAISSSKGIPFELTELVNITIS